MHYVCSDIHGQYDLYKKMLEKINFSDNDTLYILGDVIDRGPDSISILQDIMKRNNVEMFLGNHEFMMLDYLSNQRDGYAWFLPNNGGDITFSQLKKLPEKEQEAIIDYIKNTWIQKYVEVNGEKFALHHSYFIPGERGNNVKYNEVSAYHSNVFDAVWNSPYRFWEYVPEDEYDDEYTHIIGHVPVQNENLKRPPLYGKKLGKRLINIDGGCALLFFDMPGGLYCMTLEKDENGRHKDFWIKGEI